MNCTEECRQQAQGRLGGPHVVDCPNYVAPDYSGLVEALERAQECDDPATIVQKLDRVVTPGGGWACACSGCAPGEPLCRCAMQNVIRWRGQWVKLEALTPDHPERRASQDEWEVWLTGFDFGDRINVIREIRLATKCSLFEAKTLTDKTPSRIKAGLYRSEAEELKAALEQRAGARVELR